MHIVRPDGRRTGWTAGLGGNWASGGPAVHPLRHGSMLHAACWSHLQPMARGPLGTDKVLCLRIITIMPRMANSRLSVPRQAVPNSRHLWSRWQNQALLRCYFCTGAVKRERTSWEHCSSSGGPQGLGGLQGGGWPAANHAFPDRPQQPPDKCVDSGGGHVAQIQEAPERLRALVCVSVPPLSG